MNAKLIARNPSRRRSVSRRGIDRWTASRTLAAVLSERGWAYVVRTQSGGWYWTDPNA